jgi:chorismate dehydratase
MFKVGKVSYLNTIPLFYRFENQIIELVEGELSYLVSLLRDGKIHAGIVSSVEYLFNRSQYRLVPGLLHSLQAKGLLCSFVFKKTNVGDKEGVSYSRFFDFKATMQTPFRGCL